MVRSELISEIARKHNSLDKKSVEWVVDTVFNEITKALSEGNRVELRGFGTFSVRYRAARQGRNPKVGNPVQVPAKHVPFFRVGKQLRERLASKFGS